MRYAIAIAAIGLSIAGPAIAKALPAPAQTLTCASPVKSGESAASLKARFGKAARMMKVNGPEGTEFPALVIWPDDPTRRIEVLFDDNDRAMRRAASVRIVSDGSKWRVAGIGVGSNLAEVVKANGGGISVSGFGWDYGGSVDPRGGRLEHLPGGCAVGLVMDTASDLTDPPQAAFGDGVTLRSEDALIKAVRPHVDQVTLYWPRRK